jgi:hypothetical protein
MSVIQTVLDTWSSSRPTKRTTSGWISGNSPCCHHRGESKDTRGRGGFIVDANKISYHCFNCNYTTGYTIGGSFGIRFSRLLLWIGLSEQEINALKITALRDKIEGVEDIEKPEIKIIEKLLPDDSILINSVDHKTYVDYIRTRGINETAYQFYVSKTLPNKIIIPFKYEDRNVGYTTRTIDGKIPKYINYINMPYVFGLNLQKHKYTWVPVMEGIFDAISIGGCATLGNEISESQADLIDNLNKTIIIVPDKDKPGNKLIEAAINYGWKVAFPEWPNKIKDVNDAVVEYGPLFVLKHIWETKVEGTTSLKLRLKLQKSY